MSFGLSWIARALRARRLSARTMAEAYGARMERSGIGRNGRSRRRMRARAQARAHSRRRARMERSGIGRIERVWSASGIGRVPAPLAAGKKKAQPHERLRE